MNLLDKGVRKFLNIRNLSIALITVGVLGLSGIMVYSAATKTVTISDDGLRKQIRTTKKTVKEVLDQANIQIREKDSVTHLLDSVIADGAQITIKRAKPMKLVTDDKVQTILTNKETIKDVLQEQNIVLNDKDKLNIDPTQKVLRNLVVRITKLKEDIITEREPIGYKVVERNTSTVSRGSRRVAREGIQGLKEKTYKITYDGDKIVGRELVSERVVNKPVDQVVHVGVERQYTVSRGMDFAEEREDLESSRMIIMNASAYTAGYESTRKRPGDPGYGRTATGMIAKRGVVAVDPRVIPLGTKLYVEGYGYAVAADKGSAIKGNKIDLFYDNLSDALGFGRRNVRVYVLN